MSEFAVFPPQRRSHIDSTGPAGVPTDIICTSYADRHVIIITQLRKIGTLIRACSEDKSDGGKLYHVDVILVS